MVREWVCGASLALLASSQACALDSRDLDTQAAANEAESDQEASSDVGCMNGVGECAPVLAPGAACVADAECPPGAPACVESICVCPLSPPELANDAKNCGGCGFECGSAESNATCQQGRCILAGEPGPNDLARSSSGRRALLAVSAGGTVATSSRYVLQISSGQAPGGNAVMTSPRFRLEGGFVGTSSR
jgi:EB module